MPCHLHFMENKSDVESLIEKFKDTAKNALSETESTATKQTKQDDEIGNFHINNFCSCAKILP